MIHARAPHFLWPYPVCYAAHQLNLQTRVLRPEASLTSPLVLGQPFVSGAALRLSAAPLRTSSQLVPSSVSSLVSRWALPTNPFTTRPSTNFSTLVTSGLTSPCPTTPGTPVEVSRFPLPPSSLHPLPLLPPLRYPRPPPLVLPRQVASPSPQSSSQFPQQPSALARHVTVDSGGIGAGGAATGGTRYGGAHLRGAGAGGAGAGGAISGGAGAGGTCGESLYNGSELDYGVGTNYYE
ncbi:unnamed protein product [Closterium sp. NIES-53]